MDALNDLNVAQAWPVPDNFMPDFQLLSSDERLVQTTVYHCNKGLDNHNCRSLVLIFVGEYSRISTSCLLSDLAASYTQIIREGAEVLVVVRGTTAEAAQVKRQENLDFCVLADEDGRVHRDYGAITQNGRFASEAVYVVGRYGKIYLSSRGSDGPPLPTVHDILGSLYIIEGRCPECGLEEL